MIRNWIIYTATIIAMLLFTVMYHRQSGFILLLLAVVLPVLYGLWTNFYGKNSIHISIWEKAKALHKEETATFCIQIQCDRDILWGNKIRLCCWIKNGTGKICKKKNIGLLLEKEKVIEINFIPEYAGAYEVEVGNIRIYSGFSLFFRKISQRICASFFIMPDYREDFLSLGEMPEWKEGDSTTFAPFREGNDPTELLGFRGYRPGDKRNRINWKISIKTRQLTVSEYGYPIACDIGIFIDLDSVDEKQMDGVLSMVYALCVAMIERKRLCYVAWEREKSRQVVRKCLEKEEDIYKILYQISNTLTGHSISLEELYSGQFEGESFTCIYYLCHGKEERETVTIGERLHAERVEMLEL